MKYSINKEERKPIWTALSMLYLDTELQASDFQDMAAVIIESPYSIDEVRKINKYEVFPVLQANLLNVAGEWAGFQEEWLVNQILNSLKKRNAIQKLGIECSWLLFGSMHKEYWGKLKAAYSKMKSDSQ